MSTTPLFIFKEGLDGYVIYCDVYNVGLVCVLMQSGKVITYHIRQPKVNETNYRIHDLELEVVMFSLNIEDITCMVFTWCCYQTIGAFQYVFIHKELNLCKGSLFMFLKDYDISVHYHQCEDNVVADCLRKLSMGCVEHVENEMKELTKHVHRLSSLGVCLVSLTSGCVIVQNRL